MGDYAKAIRGANTPELQVADDLSTRVLWEGTMPGKPYPTACSGLDLRQNRAASLGAIEIPKH